MRLPANDWQPRAHQWDAWEYLDGGGRHAELVWHRRAGKDDVALHFTATRALLRRANYWHMLPLANQVRRAIWTAVNPHTGRRRIDEVFPRELRRATRDNEMQIEFVNGSTWQALGSDNFESAIGASPAGIVFSEWAQADPRARGYLRPILAENQGWQIYITTPRGNNHAKRTFEAAQRDPDAFAQILTAEDTGIFSTATLEKELKAYIDDYGEDFGRALFEQEYFCSFSAAVLGAYYGAEIARMEREGRIGIVPHDPAYPVFTAWDLGHTDDTAIWFFQVIGERVRIIDFYFRSGVGIAHYASQVLGREVELHISSHRVFAEFGDDIPGLERRRAYRYAKHYLPHDAKQRRIESAGKSSRDQLAAVVGAASIGDVPRETVQTGIQAVRAMLPATEIDAELCADGIEAARQYQREWDEERKAFKNHPLHNWTSHACLVGETLVTTERGDIPISDVRRGDRVLTPAGYAIVDESVRVGMASELLELTLSDGRQITATPEHQFFTQRGLIEADALLPSDVLLSTGDALCVQALLYSTARNIGFRESITAVTSGAVKDHPTCTAPCGSGRMGRFLTAATSTIRTAIRSITGSTTLNAWTPESISDGTRWSATPWANLRRLLLAPWMRQQPGTQALKESRGTGSTASSASSSATGTNASASSAAEHSEARTRAAPGSVIRIASMRRCVGAEAGRWVYDLTVRKHHCYLANGILVSNSDALRYLALAVQLERKVVPPKRPQLIPFTEQWLMSGDEDDKPKERWK
jgi:phage terminase large subunit